MVRQAIRRLVAAVGVTLAAVAFAAGAGGPAVAAPKPAPTSVQIAGVGLPNKIVVQQATRPRLFATLLDEVTWLSSAKPQITAPSAKSLGPKYTVTVLTKNLATQTYDLYPMATGGPRAHRPAKQPSGASATDGWFYGRLTMPESLRLSGVPLKAKPDVVSAGIGGGSGTDINNRDLDPAGGLNSFLAQMRRLFLLNGAVLVVILVGLAGIAFLIRRRV